MSENFDIDYFRKYEKIFRILFGISPYPLLLRPCLCSTMSETRLSSLTLISIHREITIDIENILDILAQKPRKLETLILCVVIWEICNLTISMFPIFFLSMFIKPWRFGKPYVNLQIYIRLAKPPGGGANAQLPPPSGCATEITRIMWIANH